MREGSSGVMRQCLQFPATFHYLCKIMSFPQDIFKLKYTIMPFNIDMQVHYCLHSVEGCSILKKTCVTTATVFTTFINFYNVGPVGERKKGGGK